ncbi:MAG TPA: DUF2071 domain-containing protein [Pyrinomonadaceae bacterium]|nr:DUF2071 domain-containing protein [Pyrinomonadaceae bacterium]
MRLPVIQGVIRRRILANFRVEPTIMQQQLPARFRPKLQQGFAVAGICLIRLEHIRPKFIPESVGLNSENAAHRVAVLWDEAGVTREGVFISRRDTDSQLNHLLGGRIFPGEHHQASFSVSESDSKISLALESSDEEVVVKLDGNTAAQLPATSIFPSLAAASTFFEGGALGFSVTHDPNRLDGLTLKTKEWHVEPLEISSIYSSYFSDKAKFPEGSIEFDHALIMKDVSHEWHSADDLYV